MVICGVMLVRSAVQRELPLNCGRSDDTNDDPGSNVGPCEPDGSEDHELFGAKPLSDRGDGTAPRR
ncbi:MAG: hypothetical protein QOE89_1898 [Pseudonocardiales bacterium]|nr:hypothetical protein [Pseudonocardiales bacterium]